MSDGKPKLVCPDCAYDLTGIDLPNGKTTCPECGESVDPIFRKTQSLKFALLLSIVLIAIPSIIVPATALLFIKILSTETVWQLRTPYFRFAITAPIVWVPIACLITIRYKDSSARKRDIGATLAILLGVTFASSIVYLAFLSFTWILLSGA